MIALDIPFRLQNGSLATTRDYDRIVKNQVLDAVATNRRERLMQPNWGCDIAAALFEPADDLERSDMGAYTKERLTQLLPRATVLGVVLDNPESEKNVVRVNVTFKTSPYSSESTVGLDVLVSEGS